MKKRLLSMALSAIMVLSLAACGGQAKENKTSAENASKASVTSAAKSDLKIGLITDVGGIHDHSFNETSWKGLEKAKADFGIEINYLESRTDADYTSNIETFVDEDYDLIVCVGYKLAEATKKAAEAHTEKKFAIIDDATNASLPNVTCLTFKQEQASYLVGYVAGLTRKTMWVLCLVWQVI